MEGEGKDQRRKVFRKQENKEKKSGQEKNNLLFILWEKKNYFHNIN